ncbi:MAG: peptidoglycan-binding protein [Oscillospiraceae bacterium]|jgi:g-D-glutamyl-meso-diaminopimelate peptidase|nr:peptidoglycan-binding protein [Oscillospiraceae bacterium]
MRTLRKGDSGADVELLQTGLRRATGVPQVPDGQFGSNTKETILRWQQAQALAVDGIVGPRTWETLLPFLRGYTLHEYQSDDTFLALAVQYDSTPGAIAAANPEPNQLRPGEQIVIPYNRLVVPTDIRWCSSLLELVLDGIAKRFPFVEISSIGRSVLGHPIWQASIGTGPVRVGYNAAHHANEWITTPVLMKFLEQYASGVAHGGNVGGVEYERLFRHYTLDIVPMVNPDAVDLVTGALGKETAAYRMCKEIADGFPDIPFPEGWKANIEGVDLNLQYPAGWEKARQLKYARGFNRPAPRDYVGPAPLSAPESAAMHQRALQADYQLILAYHTQGKLIYWKYNDYNPAGSAELARRMQSVSSYLPAETPDYSSSAGYKDWFIQQYNRPGYTIEAGQGKNPLPLKQFDQIYNDNFGILLLGMIGLDGEADSLGALP